MRYLILIVALYAPTLALAEYHEEETQMALPDVFWLSCANGLYKVDRVNRVFAAKKPAIEFGERSSTTLNVFRAIFMVISVR